MIVIRLNSDDDIISATDLVYRSGARRVLLLLPAGESSWKGLTLARLRRNADRLRVEVGIVSDDKGVRRQAAALGIPAFEDEAEGRSGDHGWWRGRRRNERVGFSWKGKAGGPDLPLDLLPENRSSADDGLSTRDWVLRYVTVLLFFGAISFALIGFSYGVPSATVTLRPTVWPLSTSQQIIADPQLSAVDYGEKRMPGRLLQVTQSWQSEAPTTGVVTVAADPARGQVTFVNRGDESVDIPAGTIVSDQDGVHQFQTVSSVGLVGVISSTVESDVVALVPGPQNNVAAGAVSRVDGQLSELVLVRNPSALSGGGVRDVPAVAAEDLTRLRSQVLQFLQAVAMADMETRLSEREFLARSSLRVVAVNYEVYSHQAGEQADEIRLKMEAQLQGTAVDLTQATGLMYEALKVSVPPGLSLLADTITLQAGEEIGTDELGRISFMVDSQGLVASELSLDEHLKMIEGQPRDMAVAYLYERLSLQEPPLVELWPTWFNRLPYRAARIETRIITE